MGRILLVRHGESVWNAERPPRWQGWADPPLSAAGREQAAAAAVVLADEGIEVVACSDLQRARETARIIADALGVADLIVEAGIKERDVGDWSGLTRAEINRRWPGAIEAWQEGRMATIPGGEGDINDRVTAGLARIGEQAGDRTALAVTHGGVIRSLVRHLGGEAQAAVANLGGWWVERRSPLDPLTLGPAVVFEPVASSPPSTAL